MGWVSIFFSFYGRINRAKYWVSLIVYAMIWTMVGIWMFNSLAKVSTSDAAGLVDFGFAWLGLMTLVAIVTGISSLALSVKRLHDRDKSGWWVLLFWLGPGVLGGWQTAAPDSIIRFVLSAAATAIAIWAFVELGCLRGSAGPNRYGPDPLGQPSPPTP